MLFQGDFAVLTSWIFYLSVVLVVGCGMIWVINLTKCLGLYDPLLILPLMVASYILFGGIGGGLYFDEFRTLHLGPGGYWRWVLYVGGMAMVLIALYLIATAGIAAAKEEQESEARRSDAASGMASGSASSLKVRFSSLEDAREAREHSKTAAHMPAVESPLLVLASSLKMKDALTAKLALGSARLSSLRLPDSGRESGAHESGAHESGARESGAHEGGRESGRSVYGAGAGMGSGEEEARGPSKSLPMKPKAPAAAASDERSSAPAVIGKGPLSAQDAARLPADVSSEETKGRGGSLPADETRRDSLLTSSAL